MCSIDRRSRRYVKHLANPPGDPPSADLAVSVNRVGVRHRRLRAPSGVQMVATCENRFRTATGVALAVAARGGFPAARCSGIHRAAARDPDGDPIQFSGGPAGDGSQHRRDPGSGGHRLVGTGCRRGRRLGAVRGVGLVVTYGSRALQPPYPPSPSGGRRTPAARTATHCRVEPPAATFFGLSGYGRAGAAQGPPLISGGHRRAVIDIHYRPGNGTVSDRIAIRHSVPC